LAAAYQTSHLKSRLANFPFGFEVLGERFDARKELFHYLERYN